MRKYLSFFRIRFIGGLQYRAAALAGISTQFAWGIMSIMMYSAFHRTNPGAMPMKFQELSSYIWLQQAFLALFSTWSYDREILNVISDGTIAYELARPLDTYSLWFTRTLADRVSRVVLRCMPILIFASFLPKPYGIALPSTPANGLMFIVTMVMGACCLNAFTMLVYISCFYTLNSAGIRMVIQTLMDFLCGGTIPLPFMPDAVRWVIELTPFGVMNNLPFRIYSGNIADFEMWRLFGLQVMWTVVIVIVGWFWMKSALKKVVIQGG